MAGTEPAHLVQYGHGLLGSNLEVDAGNIVAMSNEHNTVYCATKWAGFSEDDVPTAVAALGDMSLFPTFVDRMTQGFLNQLVLGRLMLADNGLITHPGFARPDGTPLIDNSELVYDGNSQGGIMGLALAGMSQDFERAVLGVVGMNYSTLLPRSVDFDTYEAIFIPAYPSALDRTLLLSVIQMVWDRTEGSGYVRHVVSRSAARHAREDGADARRVRRLAGQRADGDDRGAHDGRADPPARHRRRPQRGGRTRLGYRLARLPLRRIGAA